MTEDVYKRQVSVFGLNEFSIQGYIMPNVHGNIIGEIVLILLIFGLSIGTVSYTHLDRDFNYRSPSDRGAR